jgi:hypothetical protein
MTFWHVTGLMKVIGNICPCLTIFQNGEPPSENWTVYHPISLKQFIVCREMDCNSSQHPTSLSSPWHFHRSAHGTTGGPRVYKKEYKRHHAMLHFPFFYFKICPLFNEVRLTVTCHLKLLSDRTQIHCVFFLFTVHLAFVLHTRSQLVKVSYIPTWPYWKTMFTMWNFCLASVRVRTLIELYVKIMPFVGFEVLTAMNMKSCSIWDIMPYSPLKVSRRFGGTCSLSLLYLLHADFLLGWFFDTEDGGDMFFRSVSWL